MIYSANWTVGLCGFDYLVCFCCIRICGEYVVVYDSFLDNGTGVVYEWLSLYFMVIFFSNF